MYSEERPDGVSVRPAANKVLGGKRLDNRTMALIAVLAVTLVSAFVLSTSDDSDADLSISAEFEQSSNVYYLKVTFSDPLITNGTITVTRGGDVIKSMTLPSGYEAISIKMGSTLTQGDYTVEVKTTYGNASATVTWAGDVKYTITFVNYDGTRLQVSKVKNGETPKYITNTPEKPADDTYIYVFAGWDPEIVPATADATYTAKFDAVPKLTGISVSGARTTYGVGESFDPTGAVVTATYADGNSKAVTGYTYSPSSALKETDTEVVFTYTENGITQTASVPIEVDASPRELTGIAVTKQPDKMVYEVGEVFDSSGMVVTATYSNGTQNAVYGYTYSPTGALTKDSTTISISYSENGITKSTTLAITVNEPVPAKTLSSIKVSNVTKTSYTVGESFDTTGVIVTATFSDGTTENVKDYTYDPSGALKASDRVVEFSYTYESVKKSDFVSITVSEPPAPEPDNTMMMITIVVIVVLLVIGFAIFFFMKKKNP